MQSLMDLWRGVWRHKWKTLQYIFTCFSVIFTVVKAIAYFFPPIKFEGRTPFAVAILFSIGFAVKRVWKPSRIEIPIANCNTVIEVVFGDLFQQDGIRAIAVSEFFDSAIGKPVSDKSVHGIFLQRCFGGHPESFDKQVTEELKNVKHEHVAKVEGKAECYPIGSTALITVNQDRYIAFAFAKADPQTCKAFSDVTLMWNALNDLWKRVRIEAGGHPINLPLVGSGLSGLGLPTRDLLNLIILSVITETKAREITQRIRVVLHRSRFEDLDLRDVKQFWRE
jgi:antiphage defense system Thoeris ThsA-like protein